MVNCVRQDFDKVLKLVVAIVQYFSQMRNIRVGGQNCRISLNQLFCFNPILNLITIPTFGTIYDHSKEFATIRYHLVSFGTIWYHSDQ